MFDSIKRFLPRIGIHHYLIQSDWDNFWWHIGHTRPRLGLPLSINIEVSRACNRRCGYCPQSTIPMKQEVIAPDMWQLVLKRLQEYHWRGIVNTSPHAELSLVPNSEQYVKDLVAIGCRPDMLTNGDRPKVIAKWVEAGCREVAMTQHQPTTDKWLADAEALQREYGKKIIHIQRITDPHGWAGKTPGQDHVDRCYLPRFLMVGITGHIALCCLDYGYTHNIANIKEQSIEEIWNGMTHRRIRKETANGHAVCDMCFNCLGTKLIKL